MSTVTRNSQRVTRNPQYVTRNPQHVTRNPQHEPINQFESIMQNKPNLLDALMNVTYFLTKDYENKRLRRCVKTNPIQTQYEPNTNPIQTQFPKCQKMNVNAFSQKDYENETAFKPQKNKPNTNPIKPNFKGTSVFFVVSL